MQYRTLRHEGSGACGGVLDMDGTDMGGMEWDGVGWDVVSYMLAIYDMGGGVRLSFAGLGSTLRMRDA